MDRMFDVVNECHTIAAGGGIFNAGNHRNYPGENVNEDEFANMHTAHQLATTTVNIGEASDSIVAIQDHKDFIAKHVFRRTFDLLQEEIHLYDRSSCLDGRMTTAATTASSSSSGGNNGGKHSDSDDFGVDVSTSTATGILATMYRYYVEDHTYRKKNLFTVNL
ncbi:unnamed protein product [Amoebophrya sp. A120]|nr:unnamed protein product [Amoebophrya sp. A120]|eukprot:GSA120T00022929001.1